MPSGGCAYQIDMLLLWRKRGAAAICIPSCCAGLMQQAGYSAKIPVTARKQSPANLKFQVPGTDTSMPGHIV